ncbi:hypothetical protein [Nitrosomonas sp. Nm166]|uniref:hypothetical protein n=1 Tax=Nitrosomonas sp. Nm166 TaxID=1881054 RepID=UPI0008E22D49|nr:hypothetical protein [Nitrosomonas sp. Nm166]SFE90520.1 hypothetical protein SAMN05428977_103529 [Nitrosomonas sp. Nm166]
MKAGFVFLIVVFLSTCVNFIDSKEKNQLYEEKLAGEHSLLAGCVVDKLRSDGRWPMRILQFRNRKYLDVDASEIHAFDTRYLRNIYPAYSPLNPDAVLIYTEPTVETLPYADRTMGNASVYAFALMLKKIDEVTVNATLRGDEYVGTMAWKILQSCANAG